MSMRLKKVGDWIAYVAEGGQTFYYNDKNGEFQWENPVTGAGAGSSSSSSAPPAAAAAAGTSSSGGEVSADGAGAGADDATDHHQHHHRLDSSEWRPYKDPESGAIFWYNHVTNVSQWECPFTNGAVTEAEEAEADADAYAYGDGGGTQQYGDEGEHEVVEIHDSNDLGI